MQAQLPFDGNFMGKQNKMVSALLIFSGIQNILWGKNENKQNEKCNAFQKKSKYNSIKIHLPKMVRNCKYYISCRKNICLRIFIELRTNYNIPLCVAV